ncbi:transcription termination factor MTEF1, chloroplastic isoform X1 [Cinnamomum micranthum f. kanehirae]|uniref:Transcription termination factor MTEF1, chloroplastic isoform X1 n=1 Tax=Cinnamomum micranthum f. kanehirae TaxID=337451 RepID=A0A3S3PTB4_9MAGN|nr:transcription termination factor MTEF1, chloroplastic isoform X1 [Cinnamomum micranthum f. kanehirae]
MRISAVGQNSSPLPFPAAGGGGGGGGGGRGREQRIAPPPPLPSSRPPLPPLKAQTKRQNPKQFLLLHQQQKQDPGLLFRQKLLYLERHLHIDSLKALSQNPHLRSASLDSLLSVEHCLSSFSIDRSDMARIFGMHPQLLTCNPHHHLYPVFHFLLDDAAIPFPDIRKSIARCPRLLVSSVPSQLRPTLYFLRRLGFVAPHHAITCQTTLLLVSSVESTLIPKLDYLQSLGFSYREGEVRELKDFPQYFSFSLEGKIKRRHRLLVQHGFSMRLADMLKVSDGEFSDRLVEMRLRRIDDGQEIGCL